MEKLLTFPPKRFSKKIPHLNCSLKYKLNLNRVLKLFNINNCFIFLNSYFLPLGYIFHNINKQYMKETASPVKKRKKQKEKVAKIYRNMSEMKNQWIITINYIAFLAGITKTFTLGLL